jgi:anti-sigma28 factor (negative regulator of flagellin synthesis)
VAGEKVSKNLQKANKFDTFEQFLQHIGRAGKPNQGKFTDGWRKYSRIDEESYMNNIYGINRAGGPHPLRPQITGNSGPSQPKAVRCEKVDPVEISDMARMMHKIGQLPEIRPEKVQPVKQAIIQGRYENEEKLNIALDEFLDEYWQE